MGAARYRRICSRIAVYFEKRMTRVQLRYELAKPLDEPLLDRLGALHGVYGFLRLAPEGAGLLVEYDASRVSELDVEAHLRSAGIPIQLSA
jgi:hypothetical protein